MTMITPSYLGETIEYSSLHACRSTLEDPTTGEMISAEEALRIGLVNHVYEPAELLPAAEGLAKNIIANAPLSVKFTMEAIERGTEMPLAEGQYLETTLFGLCAATEDMREGTRAFLEKRPAQFRGK